MEDMAVQYSTEMNKKNIGEKGGSSNKKRTQNGFFNDFKGKGCKYCICCSSRISPAILM